MSKVDIYQEGDNCSIDGRIIVVMSTNNDEEDNWLVSREVEEI